ncbi:Blue-light-activated histidine kinase [Seminavis robusta]|uniref:Blue-light-activated histidine kinase n=1 Tax=Seminavis robusta TaxID=568900 RepID=A0A9N8HQT3_9STRA|nr:Blue-light-activated histidine kinase [Seminavis robusta]|eukprot:Sro1231_g254590.1 Blue-light-activated histidine kinase (523) ;mRNA; f:7043-8714
MSTSQNVNPPMFASANNKSANGASPGDPPAWLMEGSDPLDVDLLAEYLLDDGKPAPNGMTFDFNIDAAGANGNVVSPEQSEDGAFPPVAEASNAQLAAPPPPQHPHLAPAPPPQPIAQAPVHQPIAQAPAPPMQHHYHQHPGHPHAPVPPQHHHIPIAPPPMAVIPVAPAPVHVAPAPVVYAPAPVAYAPAQPVQALAPAPPGGAQMMVHHQHGNYPKRQRINPVPGVAPVPSAPAPTSSIVPGGQQLVDAAQAAMQTGGRGRRKSQAQIDRRRERNRILARRTRLRKKFFFESLQKEVMDLQRQNAALKDLVKSKFSMEESRKVLDTCKAVEKLPEAVVEACGEHAAEMEQQDFNLVRSVQQSQHSFIITDPCLQDNPIVFASDGFLKVTGYAREDVLGRNCRFLQGAETSKAKLDTIRRGISAAEDVTVTLVNYMADGTPFWNKLFIAALRDSSNNIVNFIGVVVKVASPPQGDPEFGKVLSADGQTESNGTEANAIAADGAVRAIEGGISAAVAAAQMP